jgi:hypothetical protein
MKAERGTLAKLFFNNIIGALTVATTSIPNDQTTPTRLPSTQQVCRQRPQFSLLERLRKRVRLIDPSIDDEIHETMAPTLISDEALVNQTLSLDVVTAKLASSEPSRMTLVAIAFVAAIVVGVFAVELGSFNSKRKCLAVLKRSKHFPFP